MVKINALTGVSRALLLAGMVSMSTLAAPAAMAQGSAAFGLQFGFGNDTNNDADERGHFFGFPEPELAMCLTNQQIRDAIADRGYTDISLNIPDRRHVQVRATQDGIVYLIDFNYCTDQIEDRDALRAAR